MSIDLHHAFVMAPRGPIYISIDPRGTIATKRAIIHDINMFETHLYANIVEICTDLINNGQLIEPNYF